MAPERKTQGAPPTADERAAELEFLLRLNREADTFLSTCQGEGRPLDESVQAFLDRLAPRAGALGGAVRVTPGARVNLLRVSGAVDEEAGRRLLRRESPPELEGVVTRYPLEEARRAHDDLEGRRTTGKLLLVP